MTIYDFINMATEDYYKINIYDIEKGKEILHQVELSQIEEQAEEKGINDILDKDVMSWDIDDINNEFTINVE